MQVAIFGVVQGIRTAKEHEIYDFLRRETTFYEYLLAQSEMIVVIDLIVSVTTIYVGFVSTETVLPSR